MERYYFVFNFYVLLKLLTDNKKEHHYIRVNDPLIQGLLIFVRQQYYFLFLNIITHACFQRNS